MNDFRSWQATALAQVRFKPDRESIAQELTAHYEDHVRDLERLDYPTELAEQRALDAMGDRRSSARPWTRFISHGWAGCGWSARWL